MKVSHRYFSENILIFQKAHRFFIVYRLKLKYLCFITEVDKAIIKHYHKKRYTVNKISKDNPEKHWDKALVKRLQI